jgi:hypothetical protein
MCVSRELEPVVENVEDPLEVVECIERGHEQEVSDTGTPYCEPSRVAPMYQEGEGADCWIAINTPIDEDFISFYHCPQESQEICIIFVDPAVTAQHRSGEAHAYRNSGWDRFFLYTFFACCYAGCTFFFVKKDVDPCCSKLTPWPGATATWHARGPVHVH